MNKTQLEKDIAEMKARIATMEAELAKPVKSKVFVPEIGQKYWWLIALGTATETNNEGCWPDTRRIEYGNCYETKAEAEKVAAKQFATVRVLNKLREIEGDWQADWSNEDQSKYAVHYSFISKKFVLDAWWVGRHSVKEWFSTEEAWQWVMNNMDADLRLMFGVE